MSTIDEKYEKGGGSGKSRKSSTNKETKKSFKITIRKLPVRGYSTEEFTASLDKVCESLLLSRNSFTIEHFIGGKISRKRGPVFGSGFISVSSEEDFIQFLKNCPFKCPFIEDEINAQPEITPAPNQRVFRIKEKNDKYVNTYENDPEFLLFKEKLEKPEEKLQSAELQLDTKKDVPKINFAELPLIKFLRERHEKRANEKKTIKLLTKSSVSGGGSSSKSNKTVVVTGVLKKNKPETSSNINNSSTNNNSNKPNSAGSGVSESNNTTSTSHSEKNNGNSRRENNNKKSGSRKERDHRDRDRDRDRPNKDNNGGIEDEKKKFPTDLPISSSVINIISRSNNNNNNNNNGGKPSPPFQILSRDTSSGDKVNTGAPKNNDNAQKGEEESGEAASTGQGKKPPYRRDRNRGPNRSHQSRQDV
eukprot:gene4480-6331_t